MKEQKIIFMDYEWYDAERKDFCGDMGYAFNDMNETRKPIEEIEQERRSAEEYINSDDCDEVSDVATDGFSIYELCEVVVEYDEEEGDTIFDGEEVTDPIIRDVFVIGTERECKDIVETYFKERGIKGVVFHYREEKGMFA
jgi:hypothetical protein